MLTNDLSIKIKALTIAILSQETYQVSELALYVQCVCAVNGHLLVDAFFVLHDTEHILCLKILHSYIQCVRGATK